MASRDGHESSVKIHQDVRLLAAVLKQNEKTEISLKPGRHAWVQVARGSIVLNGKALDRSDGAAVSDETTLRLNAKKDSEILLFDLP